MDEAGYQRYLHETGKVELRRFPLHLTNPAGAQLKLEELTSRPWSWWVVRHNCETFVEEIVVAGGGRPLHKGWFYLPRDSHQEDPGATGSW
jgi:hypothetical protein